MQRTSYQAVMTPFILQFLVSRMTSAGKSVMFRDTVATGKDLGMEDNWVIGVRELVMSYLSTNTACPLVLVVPRALTTKSVHECVIQSITSH